MMALPLPPTAGFAPRRADWRFLFEHPAHLIALGFGSGLSPWAAGTAGSLWAWAVFLLLRPWIDDAQWVRFSAESFADGLHSALAAATCCCGDAGADGGLGEKIQQADSQR